jgi:hypothetical protein
LPVIAFFGIPGAIIAGVEVALGFPTEKALIRAEIAEILANAKLDGIKGAVAIAAIKGLCVLVPIGTLFTLALVAWWRSVERRRGGLRQ